MNTNEMLRVCGAVLVIAEAREVLHPPIPFLEHATKREQRAACERILSALVVFAEAGMAIR